MREINLFTQEKYPDTNCKVYMINYGHLIHALINGFRVFLSENLRKRMVVLDSNYLKELVNEVRLD